MALQRDVPYLLKDMFPILALYCINKHCRNSESKQ